MGTDDAIKFGNQFGFAALLLVAVLGGIAFVIWRVLVWFGSRGDKIVETLLPKAERAFDDHSGLILTLQENATTNAQTLKSLAASQDQLATSQGQLAALMRQVLERSCDSTPIAEKTHDVVTATHDLATEIHAAIIPAKPAGRRKPTA